MQIGEKEHMRNGIRKQLGSLRAGSRQIFVYDRYFSLYHFFGEFMYFEVSIFILLCSVLPNQNLNLKYNSFKIVTILVCMIWGKKSWNLHFFQAFSVDVQLSETLANYTSFESLFSPPSVEDAIFIQSLSNSKRIQVSYWVKKCEAAG